LFTGASARNWAGYGDAIDVSSSLPEVAGTLLSDPQTSGGLLVACAPEAAGDVLALFREDGFIEAADIGEIVAGDERIAVR